MSYTVPTTEPTALYIGATWRWDKSLTDYPASTYTLTYYLRGPSTINITATADGDTHEVLVSAATTAGYTSGTYYWYSRVTGSDGTFDVNNGSMDVKPNPSTIPSGYDGRSDIKITLDAIDDLILGKAQAGDFSSYSIAGRSLTSMTTEELLKWRDYYKRLYDAEQEALKVEQGLGSGKRVLVRFTG